MHKGKILNFLKCIEIGNTEGGRSVYRKFLGYIDVSGIGAERLIEANRR